MSNIYESEAVMRTQSGSMHPGGLRLTDRAARLADLRVGMRCADIGCGSGASAAFLTEKYTLAVVGLDISGALIDIGLKNNPGLNLLRWDGQSLPFEDSSLDAAFFECTLSVLGNAPSMLAHCAKALKPSGAVIISDVYARCRAGSGSLSLYTAGELTAALTTAGFDVIISEDHTPALRNFAAELREKSETEYDVGCFFGAACDLKNFRLSDLGYMLVIARKI